MIYPVQNGELPSRWLQMFVRFDPCRADLLALPQSTKPLLMSWVPVHMGKCSGITGIIPNKIDMRIKDESVEQLSLSLSLSLCGVTALLGPMPAEQLESIPLYLALVSSSMLFPSSWYPPLHLPSIFSWACPHIWFILCRMKSCHQDDCKCLSGLIPAGQICWHCRRIQNPCSCPGCLSIWGSAPAPYHTTHDSQLYERPQQGSIEQAGIYLRANSMLWDLFISIILNHSVLCCTFIFVATSLWGKFQ